jgi:uncharacterized membrane protein
LTVDRRVDHRGAPPLTTAQRWPTAAFRRRADKSLLRWQAKLDSDWSDRVLPWLFAAGIFLILALLALARARSLDGTVDLAVYAQSTWLIQHAYEPVDTIGTGTNVLASQAAFVLYPVSVATLAGVQTGLLLLQSAALGLSVVPIWRIARRLASLRIGATITLAVVYALFPTMHTLNLAGFYPETLALPALLYAAYYGLGKHWRRYAVCCVFVVLCRADLGLAVAGLGALLWTEGRKVEGRVSLVAGVAYSAFAVLVIQPRFGGGTYDQINIFSAFGDTPPAVFGGMLLHPGDVLTTLFRRENFNLLVTLFAPVAFLPFLAPRYLLPVVPLQFLFLVAGVPLSVMYGRQTVPITAFIFVATAFAMARIGRMGVEKVTVDRRVLAVMLLSATLFFVHDSASSPYQRPWEWGGQDQFDQALKQASKDVGPTRAVRVTVSVLTLVAERPQVYLLDGSRVPDPSAAAKGVDAVVVDEKATPLWTDVQRDDLTHGLETIGFDHVGEGTGVDVYLRR